jgi:hypothetical protein
VDPSIRAKAPSILLASCSDFSRVESCDDLFCNVSFVNSSCRAF